MNSKTQTEQYLRAVVLPEQTESYTVIPHGVIIDTVREMLTDNGFTIKEELYKGEANGNIALGFMQLENDLDPDMGMTFNWANSYNKQVKFSCAIGGFIYDNQVPFVSGTNQGKWNRKHTGTALEETKEVIETMITAAHDHFAEIIAMKEQFKAIKLSRKEYAKLSGLFFFDKMLISPDQVSVLRKEYDKPAHDYSAKGTLWEYYKILMLSVVDQAPKSWYKQQADISNYINILYSISKTPVAVGEMDLKETVVTNDSMLEPSLPVEPADYDFSQTVDYSKAVHPVTPEPIENEAEEVDMTPIDNLINAQNLIKEPLTRPMESMEEIQEEDVIVEDESSIEEIQPESEYKFAVEENPAFDWGITEEPAVEVQEVSPTVEMTQEQIELVQEEHGIIEAGSPDDGLIGSTVDTDEAVEALFELTDDIDELVEEEETPWYEDENPQQDAKIFAMPPSIIPDSMREAVADILENSYGNTRQVTDSKETEDGTIFELDSQEFFFVEK